MAKKRVKKRTQEAAAPASKPGSRVPKSMVIRIGASDVGPSISQLVKDVRSTMEPHTASRLKERRGNKLRDYTTMAGPLGVSHLMLFSRSERGNTNMRLAVTPRGPTLHFRVEKYSLCRDVTKSQKRPKTAAGQHLTSPLVRVNRGGKIYLLTLPQLVMNNFSQTAPAETATDEANPDSKPVPKHLESLTTTIFQSLFAPISPHLTSLNSIKRVLLLDRKPFDPAHPHQFVLQLRHYAITTTTPKHALPKALRRLNAADNVGHAGSKSRKHALPNLGALHDVADYLLDPSAAAGFTSASESEPDTDAEVEVLTADARRAPSKEERQRVRDAQRAKALAAAAARRTGQDGDSAPPADDDEEEEDAAQDGSKPLPPPRKPRTEKSTLR